MSRPASPYTQAIRDILDAKKGNITHAEIRPMLQKAGFNVAPEPPAKTDAFGQFEKHGVKLDDPKSVEKALKACGFDDKMQRLVLKEAAQRAAFEKESNNFNVTKYNWSQKQQSGSKTPSRKPASSKNTKAKVAAKTTAPVRRGPVAKTRRVVSPVETGTDEALDLVKEYGGVAAAQARIDEMRADADKLEQAVNVVVELQAKVKAAA